MFLPYNPETVHHVGIKSGGVMDYQMTSNIIHLSGTDYFPAWGARLDRNTPVVYERPYWYGGTKPGNWIQIDLMVMYRITGFVIQGYEKKYLFMKTCRITYSLGDPMIFIVYKNSTGGEVSTQTSPHPRRCINCKLAFSSFRMCLSRLKCNYIFQRLFRL